MKNWKAIAGVLLVFVLGIAAGAFGTIGVVRHRLMHRGPRVMADFIVRRLNWQLRLDSAQRAQLRLIVDEGWEQIKAVHHQVQPEVETDHILYDEFKFDELSPPRLSATLLGAEIDFEHSQSNREIKAVTYHQLRVEQLPDSSWRATVIFDV